ncbi:small ribosomal subunit Rsm22 family protein [Inquilinus sp. CAU 1745]|uniref:small ribosomal subunit Rsm22 family protein n=1 Tax=Inquilinus sp. CAU 1745 TaxID=3140369 RepID=UPI00325A4663
MSVGAGDRLSAALERLDIPHPDPADAAALTARYRAAERPPGPLLRGEGERRAYALTRMPATLAAAEAAMAEVAARWVGARPQSLLDLGAGTGAMVWAARTAFPTLTDLAAIERDAGMAAIGGDLTHLSGDEALAALRWTIGDLTATSFPPVDLVTIGYALNELEPPALDRVVAQAFAAARMGVIVIEAGSRRGFDAVRRARALLIEVGGQPVAPCPHALACPMSDDDWCHMPTRFRRGTTHRRLVAGTLDHDIEKFSYVAVAKGELAARPAEARIVRAPMRRQGHVTLDLCRAGRLERLTVGKRDKPSYRAARQAGWGDAWPPEDETPR